MRSETLDKIIIFSVVVQVVLGIVTVMILCMSDTENTNFSAPVLVADSPRSGQTFILSANSGSLYYSPECTVKILRDHKRLIYDASPGQMMSKDPPCNFRDKQHEIDLYAQMAVEDSKSNNAVLKTNGESVPEIWKMPQQGVQEGHLYRITPEGNWEVVDDLYELKHQEDKK